MFDVKYKILSNRYSAKSLKELEEIFRQKKKKYDEMMKVLKPVAYGTDFLERGETPVWVKIAHIDEFLECPHCQEEYKEKLKTFN
jgi:hypothetical protein